MRLEFRISSPTCRLNSICSSSSCRAVHHPAVDLPHQRTLAQDCKSVEMYNSLWREAHTDKKLYISYLSDVTTYVSRSHQGTWKQLIATLYRGVNALVVTSSDRGSHLSRACLESIVKSCLQLRQTCGLMKSFVLNLMNVGKL
jgi:hypothetical protein